MATPTDFDLGTTEDWIAWRSGALDDALAAVTDLDLPAELDDAYLQAVRDVDAVVEAESCLAGGIWAPDPSGAPWGQMTLTWVPAGAGDKVVPKKVLKGVRRAPRIEGTRVLDYSAALGETDSGRPLVARVDLRGYAETGVVLGKIAMMVFPEGADGMMVIEVQTNVPSAFERLSLEAASMANALTVELG